MHKERDIKPSPPSGKSARAPFAGDSELRDFLTERYGREMTDFPTDVCLVENLGLDSLDGLELMAAVEARFKVCFTAEHLSQPKTIRNILETLEELGAGVSS